MGLLGGIHQNEKDTQRSPQFVVWIWSMAVGKASPHAQWMNIPERLCAPLSMKDGTWYDGLLPGGWLVLWVSGTVLEMLSHCCWHLGVWEVMARSSLVREMHIAEPVCFLCPHDHCCMSPLIKQYHAWTRRLTDIYRADHLTRLPRASSAIGTFWWALAEPQISAFYGPIHIISKTTSTQNSQSCPFQVTLIIYPNSYVVF